MQMPDATVPPAILESLRPLLHGAARFLVTSHLRPDGDAVGSVLAFAELLDQLGKQVDCVLCDPVPQVYLTLPGVERIRQASGLDCSAYDVAIVLECDGLPRTGLQDLAGLPVVNIDHHVTGCEYGALNWVDGEVFAVAILVYRLALELGLAVTPSMATCLYTAVFTDTGAFTYPGTAAATLPVAQELIGLGADADAVTRDVLYSVSAASIRLLGTALSRLQLHHAVAWSYLLQEDIAELGATDEDSEGTVNYLVSIAGVQAALFLRELPAEAAPLPRFRASLRSKSSLDVSAIATALGGGGHRNAAGCTVTGPLASALEQLLPAMTRASSVTTVQVPSPQQ